MGIVGDDFVTLDPKLANALVGTKTLSPKWANALVGIQSQDPKP